MTHLHRDPSCGVCASLDGQKAIPALFEDECWLVRHIDPPWGVAGWMMMIAKRHVPGPAHFDDREALSFGTALRHFERVLERTTGALRIYTAALGESHPHFHCHMVPRYADSRAIGWGLFDLQRAAAAGEVVVQESEVMRISGLYRDALHKERVGGRLRLG